MALHNCGRGWVGWNYQSNELAKADFPLKIEKKLCVSKLSSIIWTFGPYWHISDHFMNYFCCIWDNLKNISGSNFRFFWTSKASLWSFSGPFSLNSKTYCNFFLCNMLVLTYLDIPLLYWIPTCKTKKKVNIFLKQAFSPNSSYFLSDPVKSDLKLSLTK